MVSRLPSNMPTIIEDIIQGVSRELTAYTFTVSGCSECSRDPVTDMSTDAFCTSCNGEYWIKIRTPVPVSGYIFWGPSDQLNWQSGGILLEGECRVQVVSGYITTMQNADYFEVDGRTMYLKSITLRGVPEINRALFVLKEKE